jgi:hypothetical protein
VSELVVCAKDGNFFVFYLKAQDFQGVGRLAAV